jgi:hypothetical protein
LIPLSNKWHFYAILLRSASFYGKICFTIWN